MSNCPNCLAMNPFKKVHRDGAEIEICEYCNTIKEEECEEYTENQVKNKEKEDPIFYVIVGALFIIILITCLLDTMI